MELYVGLISGTSMDGVDAVLVDLSGPPPRLLSALKQEIPAALRQELLALCQSGDDELLRLSRLDTRLGELFADAALAVLEAAGVPSSRIHAIGSHGQTIRHYPDPGIRQSLQIADPNIIAEVTGIATVADFRRRDMAAGGQGAPLVPAFHAAVLHRPGVERVALNIGGLANVTVLPAGRDRPVTGFDTGPGNTLLDAWIQEHLGTELDEDARWAATGQVQQPLLEGLLADPYFTQPPPKSTGREYFNLRWLRRNLGALEGHVPPEDIQATLAALTAETVTRAVDAYAPQTQEILVCGGGVHNPLLMQLLAMASPSRRVTTTLDFGLDPDWVEAVAFAWLAKRTLDGRPGNLPAVTGARHPVVLGAIHPGSRGLPAAPRG